MSLPDQTIVQGDVAPAFQVQLLKADKTAPDLTGKTLTCRVKPTGGCCGCPGGVNVTQLQPADIIDAKGGYVQHQWVPIETESAGILLLSFNDGTQTYPNDGWYVVKVTPKLV